MDDSDLEATLWEHTEASKKLTAVYANRIYVQPLPEGMVRVNFGETMDAEPSYHTAIVATPEQAVDFANVIYRIANAMIADRNHQQDAETDFLARWAAEDADRDAVKAAHDATGQSDGNKPR